MASLSSPESRIKAAVQPGIKNQARCAGRNQESGPLRGPESRIKNHWGGPKSRHSRQNAKDEIT